MNRIQKIASYTKGSKVVCDIGCDHAYTLLYAIQLYGVEYGIAADIAIGPLQNAKKTIEENHLTQKIKTILSDGFTSIEDFFDTAILSGMGGILICDILEKSLSKIKGKRLIIEANNDTYRIRKFLFEHGFHLVEEDAIYDHEKYYEIGVYEEGVKNYNSLDIQYGPILLEKRPPAFREYYTKKKEFLISILPNIRNKEEKKKKELLLKELNHILKV